MLTFGSNLFELVGLIIGLLVAISVHEAAHAWAAFRLGDPTAKDHGRLTLNPLAHLDPIGTLMLIIFRFGWGKPVPINPTNFQNPRVDSLLTALAGPISNLIVAFGLGLLIRLNFLPAILTVIIIAVITLNLILALFNLLPIPPLDGSKILYLFLSDESQRALEQYGPWLLLAVLFVSYTGFPGIFSALVGAVNFLLKLAIG